jgi:uncharacterized membrane protein
MLQLILGLVLFFSAHSLSMVRPAWRAQAVARFGEGPFKLAYSLVSALGLWLVVIGYGAARATDPVLLYQPPVWLRHVSLLLMLPVFTLVLAAYLPGRIRQTLKHPMLIGVFLWALAHLLANGTLADLLLFGSFLVWALADLVSLGRRVAAPVPGAPPGKWNDLIAILGGLAIYGAFIAFLHRWLMGVPPIG